MTRKSYRFFCALSLLCIILSARANCTVHDDANNIITLAQPAQRIVSLAPDITEMLFAIGAGQQVVGVMRGSDYPAQAQQLPRVGSYAGIDLEKIIALKPDLIITWSNLFARDLAILKRMGIKVYVNKPSFLADIPRGMRRFGCLAGTAAVANRSADLFIAKLRALSHQFTQPVRVFYQIGPYSLMTVNKQSWINQVIALCGGQNIFADVPVIAADVSREAVLAANPQVIMAASTNNGWQQSWQHYPSVHAVQKGLLFTVYPDWIDRAGPRLLLGAAQICSYINQSRDSKLNI